MGRDERCSEADFHPMVTSTPDHCKEPDYFPSDMRLISVGKFRKLR